MGRRGMGTAACTKPSTNRWPGTLYGRARLVVIALGRELWKETGMPVSPRSELIPTPRITPGQPERYMLARPHGQYTDDDVRFILGQYFEVAPPAGLDPLLSISQMVLETGSLTSFWSQRPRRNPAGIGVTGEPGAGVSFPSWVVAVRAHVGRLLAYALPRGGESAAQQALITEALRWRPLPDTVRGRAPTLAGLAGSWAADPQYAVKISRVANEILAA